MLKGFVHMGAMHELPSLILKTAVMVGMRNFAAYTNRKSECCLHKQMKPNHKGMPL